jgi:hypothetical protein
MRIASLYDLHTWISIHQHTILIQSPYVEDSEGLSLPSKKQASYSMFTRNVHGQDSLTAGTVYLVLLLSCMFALLIHVLQCLPYMLVAFAHVQRPYPTWRQALIEISW